MFVRRSVLLSVVLLLPLAACRKAEVSYYKVPKEKDPEPPGMTAGAVPAAGAPAAAPGMAGTPVPTAEGPSLRWTAPADWKTKPASAMRKGSYAVPGDGGAEADLSITAFPGDVGGEVANVNRWRNQLQLPPLDDTAVAAAVTRVARNGLKFTLVDFASTGSAAPQRIVGAMVPVEGATWFFKLMGPDAAVAKAKPAFEAFLATVKPFAAP